MLEQDILQSINLAYVSDLRSRSGVYRSFHHFFYIRFNKTSADDFQYLLYLQQISRRCELIQL